MMKSRYLLLFLCTLLSGSLRAQHDLTLHFMPGVVQSNASNPAFIPERGKFSIGLPILSGISTDLSHSGFRYKDLIKITPDDSLMLDVGNIINNKIKKINYIALENAFSLLAVHFKIKNMYAGITVTEKLSFRLSYPRDLFKLLWYGNGAFEGQTASFDGIGFDMMHYREYAASFAMPYGKWTFGGRMKYLAGMMNIQTAKSDVSLYTDPEYWELTTKTDIRINTAGLGMINDSNGFNAGKYLMNMKNSGTAMDLGATYKFTDKITFAASIVDMGFISWKSDVKNHESKGDFTYKGLGWKDVISTDSFSMQPLLDTLEERFGFDETSNAYTTPMTPKVYLSGTYKITPKDQLGALFYTEYFDRLHPALTFSYARSFGHILTLAGTYSMFGRNYANVGLGMVVKSGPFQWYCTQDNLFGWFWPKSTNNFNLRFGINLVIGAGKKKEKASKPQEPEAK